MAAWCRVPLTTGLSEPPAHRARTRRAPRTTRVADPRLAPVRLAGRRSRPACRALALPSGLPPSPPARRAYQRTMIGAARWPGQIAPWRGFPRDVRPAQRARRQAARPCARPAGVVRTVGAATTLERGTNGERRTRHARGANVKSGPPSGRGQNGERSQNGEPRTHGARTAPAR
jgi:hypothetical protein